MNFVNFCILCIAIGLVGAFVHKNPSGWSNSVQMPPKSALATTWSDTFILPHEVPFARALSVPILLYLANNPIEKTKRVFGVVSKLLRVEESSNVRKSSKEELLALVATVQPNGIGANEAQRQSINELAKLVEACNPSSKPARSSLNSGLWRMLYTDYSPSGPSSGQLGPFIGDVFQQLCPQEGRISNILEVHRPPISGTLNARQSIVNDETWRIVFESVGNKLGPISLPTKAFPPDGTEGAQVRLWRHTYLDQDLRILRAGREDSTDPQDTFLFITVREE